MTPVRLDRLSALLEGVAPVVTLSGEGAAGGDPPDASAPPALHLHLLIQGNALCHVAGHVQALTAPALVVRASAPGPGLTPRGPARVISLRADLTGPLADLLLQEFEVPRVVADVGEEPTLQLAMSLMASELHMPRCGHPALLSRAGDILFIGLLRHWVAHPGPAAAGLFAGLAEPRLARALVAMHQRPAWGWNLEHLAHEAGMSRTAFATAFRRVVQKTPGRYLAEVRWAVAQRVLDQGQGLKQAARASGYRNVSALSRALTRQARGQARAAVGPAASFDQV